MNGVFKSLVSVLFAGSLALSAQASVIVTASAPGVLDSTVAGVTHVSFDNGTCAGYASCSGLNVVSGSSSGVYAAPFNDTTKYSTVSGGASTTFNLGSVANYFGLYWGSIDGYNTISFYLGNAIVASYTGTPVTGLLQDGGQSSWASNRYINFNFVNATFDKVVLQSASNAFETDNHAFGKVSVPEPSTVLLMALGLFGLVATRRFNRA